MNSIYKDVLQTDPSAAPTVTGKNTEGKDGAEITETPQRVRAGQKTTTVLSSMFEQ